VAYSTSNTLSLQPLLFNTKDFSSCFFRKPTERELEFLILYSEGYRKQKARAELERLKYLAEEILTSISRLEM